MGWKKDYESDWLTNNNIICNKNLMTKFTNKSKPILWKKEWSLTSKATLSYLKVTKNENKKRVHSRIDQTSNNFSCQWISERIQEKSEKASAVSWVCLTSRNFLWHLAEKVKENWWKIGKKQVQSRGSGSQATILLELQLAAAAPGASRPTPSRVAMASPFQPFFHFCLLLISKSYYTYLYHKSKA